ncbi:hypothetical protein LI98_03610 [Mycolicibacterium smegmatis]|nr:hypothetical protein LI98_03610 [Mycolicibacterium smegmatis]
MHCAADGCQMTPGVVELPIEVIEKQAILLTWKSRSGESLTLAEDAYQLLVSFSLRHKLAVRRGPESVAGPA